MRDFNFYSPTKIIFGNDKIKDLAAEIKRYSNRVLLVYGKESIKKNGIYDAVINELKEGDIQYKELAGVDPNPRVSTVREGAALCKDNNLEFVLAVGGGSVIDCAKAISAAALYEGDPWDFSSRKAMIKKALPIGCVLTISATGSEMNCGFVITNEEKKLKNGSGSMHLYPKFSILNPAYTYTVSQYHTAAGVVDIMTHVYEYYFSHTESAFLSHRISEAILGTCIRYGEIALNEPQNYEARANLMWASSLALNGITACGTIFDGFNHTVEHVISGIYDLTHGAGLAILAPHWMEYILDESTVDKFAQFAENVWNIRGEDRFEVARKGIHTTKAYYKRLGMPVSLSEVGIDSSGFCEILDKCFSGDRIGKFKELAREDVLNILHNAL